MTTTDTTRAQAILGRWWEFAADPMLCERLVRFICAREGREYVPQGSGGHPEAASVEGLRGVVRDWLQWTVVDALAERASAPCEYVEGDASNWETLGVCYGPRADDGRSLYCAGHAARVREGDRGAWTGRESVMEYRRTGVVPTAPNFPVLTRTTDIPEGDR